MENQILEKVCNKIIDVVYETFSRKYYFARFLSQKMVIYILLLEKKEGDLLEKKKMHFIKKYSKFPKVFLNGTVTNITFWVKSISLTQN